MGTAGTVDAGAVGVVVAGAAGACAAPLAANPARIMIESTAA
jgi:hypothetical protein